MSKLKIALIYGGIGQNGYLLSKFLLKKKYKIYSIIKNDNKSRFNKKIKYLKIDLMDFKMIYKFIKKIKPDEIYNFLGPSDKISFEKNAYQNFRKDFICNLNTLESVRKLKLKTKIFYSSSSEVFGSLNRIVSENSLRFIENNYALTKNLNEILIQYYREYYGVNVCFGLLFNHDSKFRKDVFLYKILYDYFKKKKFTKPLKIKNIDDKKFRSNADKVVEVIWKILRNYKPKDFIISSDKSYSVKNLIDYFARINGIKLNWVKKDTKIYALNNNKILIDTLKNKNLYNLKPNLKKLKNNLNINPKDLRIF